MTFHWTWLHYWGIDSAVPIFSHGSWWSELRPSYLQSRQIIHGASSPDAVMSTYRREVISNHSLSSLLGSYSHDLRIYTMNKRGPSFSWILTSKKSKCPMVKTKNCGGKTLSSPWFTSVMIQAQHILDSVQMKHWCSPEALWLLQFWSRSSTSLFVSKWLVISRMKKGQLSQRVPSLLRNGLVITEKSEVRAMASILREIKESIYIYPVESEANTS